MKKNLRILTGLVLLVLFGCAEQQNFDQYDDISVTPTLEGSLLYVETPESEINQASGGNFIVETFNFDAFTEGFVSDNLLDGSITYQLENTTSKPLELQVEFLDEGGNVLDTEFFSLDPAPTAILNREVAYGMGGRSIDIIRNTSAFRLTATNLGDSSSTSAEPQPRFIFRSSAQFRIELKG